MLAMLQQVNATSDGLTDLVVNMSEVFGNMLVPCDMY